MANERLRATLLQRGLTLDQLAEQVEVDAKTVERWIGGRVPYRRSRYAVAMALGVEETYLWPQALSDAQLADAAESEILTVYPHRWTVPRGIQRPICPSVGDIPLMPAKITLYSTVSASDA